MTGNQILRIGNEQYRFFLENFRDSLPEGKEENIHQFRVAIKRLLSLKAFLIENCSEQAENEFARFFSVIRPVYKSSGKVRNLQVILRSITDHFQYFPPAAFTERLIVKLHDHKNRYRTISNEANHLTERGFSFQLNDLLEKYYHKGESEFVDHIAHNKMRACSSILNNQPGKEWHEARRWFKRNYLLLQMVEEASNEHLLDEEMVYYRYLEQLLGQWHDLLMLEKQTSKFVAINSKSDSEWMLFKQEIADNMTSLEEEVLKSL